MHLLNRYLNKLNFSHSNNIRKMLFIGFIQAITYEIYFQTSISDFRLTASVPILAVFYYFNRTLNPIATAFFIAFFDCLTRGGVAVLHHDTFLTGVLNGFPLIGFDLTYGLMYYAFFKFRTSEHLLKWFLGLWACDVVSNIVELMLRLQSTTASLDRLSHELLTSGMFRTAIAILAIILIKYYRVLLHRDRDLEKYRSLLGVISDLKGEIYYMQLNMEHIESVMTEAFELYENAHDSNVKRKALKISKDVHEIKKNYIRVISGVEKIGIDSDKAFQLNMSEITSLLKETLTREILQDHLNWPIKIRFDVEDDLPVKDHYLMMSVLRNLLSNSYESILQHHDIKPRANASISLQAFLEKDQYLIYVTDTGVGIKPEDLPLIFMPGYSTKFRVDGTINRGVGLTLVKELVETYFDGTIEVKSQYGHYTTFILKIPESALEGGTS